ncbi:flagellar hook-basal body complex protein FliE [Photobacterium kasasachensis]|uniref:flagellar hook-basal body complex protein FliE n=1 Tax=Photobacterium kasasachensis TaxID=2910240 RepID=UPI003D0B51A8
MIDSIVPIASKELFDVSASESISLPQPSATDFGNMVQDGLQSVNESIAKADSMTEAFALGEADIQDVMLAVEEANMTMQLAITVRNKTVEGLQELLRMQL